MEKSLLVKASEPITRALMDGHTWVRLDGVLEALEIIEEELPSNEIKDATIGIIENIATTWRHPNE